MHRFPPILLIYSWLERHSGVGRGGGAWAFEEDYRLASADPCQAGADSVYSSAFKKALMEWSIPSVGWLNGASVVH